MLMESRKECPFFGRLGIVCAAILCLLTALGRAADDKSLKGDPKEVGDATATPLTLEAKSLLPCMAWADKEGTGFYALDSDGVLRLISYPEFNVKQEKDLEHKVAWLSISSEGLVVSVPDKHEVWVVDPAKLEVKKKIEVPSLKRAVSAPGISIAAGCGEGVLYAVNLKSGKTAKYEPPKNQRGAIGFEYPAMSPDGKYLFTDMNEVLLRFKLQKGLFTFDEMGPRIGNGFNISISPDSKFVCMPSPSAKSLEGKAYTTTIYPVANLKKPECVLESGAYPITVGFDSKGGWIYAQNSEYPLLVFTSGGVKKKEYKLTSKRGENVRQLLAHPSGNKVIAFVSEKLYFVEIPAKK
jgi:hypothetical protein